MKSRSRTLVASLFLLACNGGPDAMGSETDPGSSGTTIDDPTAAATAAQACAPGSSLMCACPDGSSSTQVCNADGQAYGPCGCEGGTGTGTSTTTTTTTDSTTTTTTTAGSSSGGIPTEPFSFFVTSMRAMQELSGSQDGFGGDLRFGEQGPGAGLRGADKICAAIAEESMPGSSAKGWRAFLSVTADENGQPVDAIDRVGAGPWYDRLGRLVAMTPADLANERPLGGDPAIADDLPNEDGVPNHQPDPLMDPVDNHDTLTGSNQQGRLAGPDKTCSDWTSSEGQMNVRPRIGHSWPRNPDNGRHWISDHEAGGCGAGINILQMGGPAPGDYTVGAGGGYGGIYCFALNP